MEKISRKELKNRINKVLEIVPDLEPKEVWIALLKKYPYSEIEDIMHEQEEDSLEELRTTDADIVIVNNGKETNIEAMINDKKPKQKQRKK